MMNIIFEIVFEIVKIAAPGLVIGGVTILIYAFYTDRKKNWPKN